MHLFIFMPTLDGGRGGAERVAVNLANELCLRGYAITLGFFQRESGVPSYQVDPQIRLFPWKRSKGADQEVVTQLSQLDFDACFIFYFNRQIFRIFSALKQLGLPIGVQECTNPQRLVERNLTRLGKLSAFRAAWEREVLSAAATRIRVTMPNYVDSFPDYIKPQVRAFYNAVLPVRKAPLFTPVSGSKTLINVGGMKENKDIRPLILAFATLADEFADWNVKVFSHVSDGADAYLTQIKQLIDEQGLAQRFLLMGPTDDMYSEYENAHLHVITSLSEGNPMCVCEAMSHGIPSIGFEDCSGTNQLIKHQRNGYLASATDRVSSLCHWMRQIMTAESTRTALGEQAYADSADFDKNTVYRHWEGLFDDLYRYKDKAADLLAAQCDIDRESALHSKRMLNKLSLNGVAL